MTEIKKEKSIQMSLFDYFNDFGAFTLQQANECVLEHYQRDVKIPSIRARIYEGIDKGLFKRLAKGVFIANTEKNACLLVQGNGRDLSMLDDDSVDAIICDHPYDLKKSHVGGNRQLIDYDCFKYDVSDFEQKYRVLKPGGFLIEMLPERNADNIEYLNEILNIAKKCNRADKMKGFELYAIVPWKKGDFVINQGRKSKNTEDMYFFTKGKARNLKLDNKKNLSIAKNLNLKIPSTKSEDVANVLIKAGIEPFYMSGTNGMLPTEFDYQPASTKEKIHKAEKPVELFEDIIKYISLENELILDQYAGSGNLGKAALNTNRNAILIEQDEQTFEKIISSYEEYDALVEVAEDHILLNKDVQDENEMIMGMN